MLYQLSYAHQNQVFNSSHEASEAGGTRTPVHRLRRPMLYPPELLPRPRRGTLYDLRSRRPSSVKADHVCATGAHGDTGPKVPVKIVTLARHAVGKSGFVRAGFGAIQANGRGMDVE